MVEARRKFDEDFKHGAIRDFKHGGIRIVWETDRPAPGGQGVGHQRGHFGELVCQGPPHPRGGLVMH
jgi:hypothetical protein